MKRIVFIISFVLVAMFSYATQYGPFWMYNTVEKPAGYTKVVCFSDPQFIAVGAVLVNVDTQEHISLSTSGMYLPIWYFYVPAGTYEVYSIVAINANIKINGFDVEEGDIVVFGNVDGSLIAYPSN